MVGYNVQTAVDTKHHLIVAHEVSNVGTDRRHLTRMAKQARAAIGAEALGSFAPATHVWKVGGLALSVLAIWLAGIDVYKEGLAALRHRRLNINALMTVAVTGAFVSTPATMLTLCWTEIISRTWPRGVVRTFRVMPSNS